MGGSTSVEGFRVIHRMPNSPLEEAGLHPYTDFIVSANGIHLNSDGTFSVIIAKSVNCRVFLKVFSVLTREVREAVVTPREEWGGSGLLGGSVRFEEWNSDEEFGIRVLNVLPGSIAEKVELVPGTDYIVGTDEISVTNIEQLAGQTLNREKLCLDVFSTLTKEVRRTEVTFNSEIRSLGLDLGQGFVHSLEKQLESQPTPPPPAEKPEIPLKTATKQAEEGKIEAKVTYLQPKEEEKVVPPPPKLTVVKESTGESAPIARIYRILGPPNIYERDGEGGFIINILKSPYVKPAEA